MMLESVHDRCASLTRVGIDEISYKRGHRYLTVVVDHDSGRLVKHDSEIPKTRDHGELLNRSGAGRTAGVSPCRHSVTAAQTDTGSGGPHASVAAGRCREGAEPGSARSVASEPSSAARTSSAVSSRDDPLLMYAVPELLNYCKVEMRPGLLSAQHKLHLLLLPVGVMAGCLAKTDPCDRAHR